MDAFWQEINIGFWILRKEMSISVYLFSKYLAKKSSNFLNNMIIALFCLYRIMLIIFHEYVISHIYKNIKEVVNSPK